MALNGKHRGERDLPDSGSSLQGGSTGILSDGKWCSIWLPNILFVIIVFAGDNYTISNQERRVKSNTKLTNQISGLFCWCSLLVGILKGRLSSKRSNWSTCKVPWLSSPSSFSHYQHHIKKHCYWWTIVIIIIIITKHNRYFKHHISWFIPHQSTTAN